MKDEQQYTIAMIKGFLSGTSRKWDWDDFTSCSLRDPRMNSIRHRASRVDLPLDEEGEAVLQQLLAAASELPDWRCVKAEADDANLEFGYRWWQRGKIGLVFLVLILIAADHLWRG